MTCSIRGHALMTPLRREYSRSVLVDQKGPTGVPVEGLHILDWNVTFSVQDIWDSACLRFRDLDAVAQGLSADRLSFGMDCQASDFQMLEMELDQRLPDSGPRSRTSNNTPGLLGLPYDRYPLELQSCGGLTRAYHPKTACLG